MKILFLCTAHNSLSQRLYLALSTFHHVTIEYALSEDVMISATKLANPDLIICPFLTARVPKEVYENYMTLIIHPGPPGDAGPSSLDWVLLGDNGTVDNAGELLNTLSSDVCRTHWGITVLQAIEQFDAGPVWAFEQFSINIDQQTLSKSELYRGAVSRAAISATLAAVRRIQDIAFSTQKPLTGQSEVEGGWSAIELQISPDIRPHPEYKTLSVATQEPFQGGPTFHRPLLKAAQREFNVAKHTAQQISRRIRCGDSQPGSLSKVFGPDLYVYGGIVEDCPEGPNPGACPGAFPGTVVATRNSAVCIATCDGRGVWITHVRRPKKAKDAALWPKVPAVSGLVALGVLTASHVQDLQWDLPNNWAKSPFQTFQEVWIDFVSYAPSKQAAYLYFDFYNGAMATDQCSYLIQAMDYIIASSTSDNPVCAVVLMGGQYFSNGIALNVIEASSSPATESWLNINRIDDVVHYLLHEFRSRNIVTIAGVRGNAAAGGVALAAACDIVVAGSDVVLNPAYRGIGLYGSEYHSLSYSGRCGPQKAYQILRSMTPLSPFQARSIGLVDHVFPGNGSLLDKRIRNHVAVIVRSGKLGRIPWTAKQELSPAVLAQARAKELSEMAQDFYSPRSVRYHSRRFNFVRKVKPKQTPLRFATHRRFGADHLDEEEHNDFDDVEHYQRQFELQLQHHFHITSGATTPLSSTRDASSIRDTSSTRDDLHSPRGNGETMFSCYYAPVKA
ncbi:ClpP/crotonase [Microthyrium microscopicum]|uniref:ClpP/crotonase n=1 Tax=Microthyrium microscopicum TaxID=703497 RepID=A0A6A6TXH6_9PEZI|nr:ClpP/crotonase [Microthyrium microscopicum]